MQYHDDYRLTLIRVPYKRAPYNRDLHTRAPKSVHATPLSYIPQPPTPEHLTPQPLHQGPLLPATNRAPYTRVGIFNKDLKMKIAWI